MELWSDSEGAVCYQHFQETLIHASPSAAAMSEKKSCSLVKEKNRKVSIMSVLPTFAAKAVWAHGKRNDLTKSGIHTVL